MLLTKLFDPYNKEIARSSLSLAEGKLQREWKVIHPIARRYYDMCGLLREMKVSDNADELVQALSRSDERDESVTQRLGKKCRLPS